jgi:alpha-L-fucosidase 2
MKHSYRKSLRNVMFIATLILSSNAIYAQGAGMSATQKYSGNEIWFKQPASTWLEALPLGNGTMGAMIYGQTDKEKIQFNENSLVTGTTDIVGFYQPFGNLLFDFGHENTSDYKRSLSLSDAMHTITYQHLSTQFKREYFVSQPDQALVMMITADKKSAVNMAIALKDTRASQTAVTSNSMSFRGKLQENGMEYMAKAIVNAKGGKRINTDSSIVVENADTVLVYMSAITSFKKFNVRDVFGALPVEMLNARLAAVSKQSYKSLRARHISDFGKLFNRVKLDLGPQVLLPTDQRLLAYNKAAKDNGMEALLFQYGRYLLISSSRKGGLPANLQGLWNNEVKPAWYSQYTTNINIQMNYWSAEVTNISETHLPMLDWVENLGRVQKTSTDSVLKTKSGWVAYSTNNIMGGPSCWRLHRPGSAWLSQHFWEHYAFTLDTVFLRDRAYPFLKEIVKYWEGHLVEGKNGQLITPDGWSPEHGPGKNEGDKNPYPGASYDQQIVDELFTNYIAAAKVLGKDVAYRMKVESMQKQLLKAQIGRWGQLQEWMEDWDDSTDHHRHNSHMFAVHPGKQIDPIHTPQLSAAARRSLEARGAISTGWSSAWKINIWARLFDGDNAHVMVRGLLKPVNTGSKSGEKGGINPNLFGSYPPFQMDANFGFTAGIAEMLLQSHNDIIHLLPALPSAWDRGEVSGLKARGNVLVEMKWAAGKLTQVKLISKYNGNFNILYNGKQLMLKMVAGKTYALNGSLSIQ